jgi:hypothetical protein
MEKIRKSSRYAVQAKSFVPLAVIMLHVKVIPYISNVLCIFEGQVLDVCTETDCAEFTVFLSIIW